MPDTHPTHRSRWWTIPVIFKYILEITPFFSIIIPRIWISAGKHGARTWPLGHLSMTWIGSLANVPCISGWWSKQTKVFQHSARKEDARRGGGGAWLSGGGRKILHHRFLLRRCVSSINYDFNKSSESSAPTALLMAVTRLLSRNSFASIFFRRENNDGPYPQFTAVFRVS